MSTIPKQVIEKVDALWWSPEERATGIHNLLANELKRMEARGEPIPSDWDKLCYHIESIAMLSVGVGDTDLITMAKMLVKWLYTQHYNAPERIYGKPDKTDK